MNRSELLFLYDINDANPNGDPLDENKPRIDEETEINLVTDVRLKRTIRDYLANFKNQGIFVQEKKENDGTIQDAKSRALDYLPKDIKDYKEFNDAKNDLKDNILGTCIDVRLFGATIPLELKIGKKVNSSLVFTGPVQFRMGRSLHKVEMKHIKGTGAFASGKGKEQKTFREEYMLPYSLIGFYGIINENAAKTTAMKEEDIQLLLDGMWNGTKNLITRSKFGQIPRLLLQIEYSEDNFFIGDLNNKLALNNEFDDDKKIRKITEVQLDSSVLIKNINENKDKISKVYYKLDENLNTNDQSGNSIIEQISNLGITTEEIQF